MIDPEDYIFVGKIGKTTGIDGSLTIVPLTSFPERFSEMESFFLTKVKKPPVNAEIQSIDHTDKRIIVKLKGVDTIESAKKLIGYRITIHKDERVDLPEDHYYIDDLEKCEVHDEVKGLLGRVTKVIEMSSNDIYVVDHLGKEVLIPAISEFVTKVDIENKRIDVSLIDGMIPDEN